jgi:hypothetical protein
MVMYRIVSLTFMYGKYYKGGIDAGKEVEINNRIFKKETNTISGKRGSIFSSDGTVLLSNVFIYDLYWYPSYVYDLYRYSSSINEKNDMLFLSKADSLIQIFYRLNPKNSIDFYNKAVKDEYLKYRQAYNEAFTQTKSKDNNVKKQGFLAINKLREKQ